MGIPPGLVICSLTRAAESLSGCCGVLVAVASNDASGQGESSQKGENGLQVHSDLLSCTLFMRVIAVMGIALLPTARGRPAAGSILTDPHLHVKAFNHFLSDKQKP